MYHGKRSGSTSPERGRSDERSTGPKICGYKLKRRCVRTYERLGKVHQCPDLHLDDNNSDHDGDGDDGGSSRGERSWRDERFPRDELRTSRDDRSPSNERSSSIERSRSTRRNEANERGSSRGERSWRDERFPRDEPRRTSRDDRSPSNERSSSIERSRSHGRTRRNESRYPDERSSSSRTHKDEKKSNKICRRFEMGICSLGKSCRDAHPGGDEAEREADKKITCVYFVRGLCKRGPKCKYAHPEPDLRSLVQKQIWLKFCKRHQLRMCEEPDCSYLHLEIEDKALYTTSGLISANALSQAIRKALRFNINLKDNKPVCKEKLDDECKIVGCPFLHTTREEFVKMVLSELKKEFEVVFGPSECLFHSVKAQQDIIQTLLLPAGPNVPVAPNVPAAPLMYPSMPLMNPMMQTMPGYPPPVIGIPPPMQPPEDINTVLRKKLSHANEEIIKENEKYKNYIRVLREENYEMNRALDSHQPATDLDDFQRRILAVFEKINWKSDLNLMVKSKDYAHKATAEDKPENSNDWQTKNPSSNNWPKNAPPAYFMGPMGVIPPTVPPFMPPAVPPFMPPAVPPFMPPPIMKQGPAQMGTSDSSSSVKPNLPQNESNSQNNTGVLEGDNYNEDPMEVAEEDDEPVSKDSGTSDVAEEDDKPVSKNSGTDDGWTSSIPDLMSIPTSFPVPVDGDAPWNKKKTNTILGKANLDWVFKRHLNQVLEKGSEFRVPEEQNVLESSTVESSANETPIQNETPDPGTGYTPWTEVNKPTQTYKNYMNGGKTTPLQSENEKNFAMFLKQVQDKARESAKEHGSEQSEEEQQKSAAAFPVDNYYYNWIMGQHLQSVGPEKEVVEADGEAVQENAPKKKKKKKKNPKKEDPFDPCKLVINNFSSVHNKDNLAEYFGKFGRIVKIKTRLYFGFIVYEDPSIVEKVLNHDEPHIVSRFEVHVKGPPKKKPEEDEKEQTNMEDAEEEEEDGQDSKSDKKFYAKVWVDGFTEEHDSDSVEEYFRSFGKLTRMVLRPTYGTFDYEDPAIAEQIRQQTEHVINGIPVYVRPLDEIREMMTSDVGKILVGDLTSEHSMSVLLQYFRKFGKVTYTKHLSSHAFITFADPSIAQQLFEQRVPHLIRGVAVSIRPPGAVGTDEIENKNNDDDSVKQTEEDDVIKEESQNDDDSVKQADETETIDEESQYVQVEPSAEKRVLRSHDREREGSEAKRLADEFVPAEEIADELDLMHAKELGLMEEVDEYNDTNLNEQEDFNLNEQEDTNFNEQENYNSNECEDSNFMEHEDPNLGEAGDSYIDEDEDHSLGEDEDHNLGEDEDHNLGEVGDPYIDEDNSYFQEQDDY